VHLRVAPRADSRVLRAALILTCVVQAAWVMGCRADPSDQFTAEWMIDPSPPAAGGDLIVLVTLRDNAQMPVLGAQLHLEGQMSHPGMAPVVTDFKERGGGVYEGHLKLTMAGDWTLVATGELRGGVRLVKQLDLPGVRGSTG